jgi:RNA polymerase sigma factor (TIGR02999 family)
MDHKSQQEVTRLLDAISAGDDHAAEELLPRVYEELRALARSRMANEPAGHTLQPTALVHEAYLRLVSGSGEQQRWDNRGHFFGAAALAMRRILVERARRQHQLKRGGGRKREDLQDNAASFETDPARMLALDEALKKLEAVDARKAQIVMLRYFSGLNIKETAEAAGVSEATVSNDWAYAKAWLFKEMAKGDSAIRQLPDEE